MSWVGGGVLQGLTWEHWLWAEHLPDPRPALLLCHRLLAHRCRRVALKAPSAPAAAWTWTGPGLCKHLRARHCGHGQCVGVGGTDSAQSFI